MRIYQLIFRPLLLSSVIFLLIAPGFSSAHPLAPGASIIVNTTEDEYGDGPSCSLREAIQAANTDAAFGGCPAGSGADVITIQRSGPDVVYKVYLSRSGDYGDDNATGDLNINSDMTIQGDGMHTTGIDAQYVLPNRSGIFDIENVSTMISVTIKKLGLINGDSRGENGGAISNKETLLLEDVAIQASHSDAIGGAIISSPFNNGSQSTTLRRCFIVGNSSIYQGGGIANVGSLIIEDSWINSNTTEDITGGKGGGIFSDTYPGNEFIITGSIFRDNTAASNGGNLYISSTSSIALIEESIITGGTTEYGDGGNIYAETDPEEPMQLTIRRSEISDGYAGFALGAIQVGGGIYSAVPLTLENVTISGNYAQTGGGIYSAESQSASNFKNVTVAYNTHDGDLGAGFYKAAAGPIYFYNSIVALNGLPNTCDGRDCDCYHGGVLIGSGPNLESGNSCGFSLSGIDPQILPLGYNWGTNRTHALIPGSPAIDTGNNVTCLGNDQRGWFRPVDGDADGTATCDIGAFEYGHLLRFLPLVLKAP